jgi:hypothetical protein
MTNRIHLTRSADFNENLDRSMLKGVGSSYCIRCGRTLRKVRWFIAMVYDDIVPVTEHGDHDGGFLLGSECAKHVPLTHRVRCTG